MTIQELIKDLNMILKERGNLKVVVNTKEPGFTELLSLQMQIYKTGCLYHANNEVAEQNNHEEVIVLEA